MMTEEGRVVSIEEDGLWVETHKKSVCAQCSAKKGCGQSLVAESLMDNMSCVKAHFLSSHRRIWKEGDTVVIGIEESALLRAAFVSYLGPLLIMLLGAYLGSFIGDHDLYSAFGALSGLALGFCFSKIHSASNRHRDTYHAVVIE